MESQPKLRNTVQRRKGSTNRPAMNKKSPYKSPIKAGKSPAKQNSVAKKLSPIRKQMKKSPTKQEKAKASLRAQEWAKQVIVIDDDDSVEEEPKVCVASVKQTKSTTTNNVEKCENPASAKCETLHKSMLKLDIENQKMKKSDGACDKSTSEEEEVFYDALEFLPKQKKDDDVTVEDVSDVEDDEIRDLRSVQRNRAPSRGWMEPLEPEGFSFSTFSSKLEP